MLGLCTGLKLASRGRKESAALADSACEQALGKR